MGVNAHLGPIQRAVHLLRASIPLAVFLALWQGASTVGLIDRAFLPSATQVGSAFGQLIVGGEIQSNLMISLFRAYSGLVCAIVFGTACGLAMAQFRWFDRLISPLVGATYSLPKSALIPLFLLWFGIGSMTAVAAVFLACLLPVLVHAYHGVKSVPPVLVWSAQALGTTPRRLFWRVLLPAALPSIATGIRIALGFSYVLTVSAEMIASTTGIGKLIFMYGENGVYSYMFAAILSVLIVSFTVDYIYQLLVGRALAWHEGLSAEQG